MIIVWTLLGVWFIGVPIWAYLNLQAMEEYEEVKEAAEEVGSYQKVAWVMAILWPFVMILGAIFGGKDADL